ncbi:checkpoint protein HUS1-like [Phymastichus coffea]|uniref:checkpoint protein HUS1-like n=1 Tax=Phymastichus coffea TaxID=108790 RepID=UPI00273C6411|nr:checkpoint protein HUS1-like [Phymastichus coffea]XP_058789720.1 checkpoint protein HUS1-like [Phymastichus coffea]XP_058789721.1 checkpoint protein HUS1-like [Phymastichus coffea]
MKFKCKMTDTGALRDFSNVVTVIARMAKMCVIRLTSNSFNFNLADDSTPMVWAKLDKEHFFVDYLVSGKSEEFNEIYMEISTAILVKTVVTFKTTAKTVKIKLTNKHQPCLTFDIELSSISSDTRLCVHDLPVVMVPQKKWKEYNEPQIERFDISLDMPEFKHLRGVMERIKNLSPTLVFSADTNGTLMFTADADAATISVNFSNLAVHDCSAETETISASIDIKKFHALLGWDTIHPTIMRCSILSERVIVISINLEEYLHIKYYIPAIAL